MIRNMNLRVKAECISILQKFAMSSRGHSCVYLMSWAIYVYSVVIAGLQETSEVSGDSHKIVPFSKPFHVVHRTSAKLNIGRLNK